MLKVTNAIVEFIGSPVEVAHDIDAILDAIGKYVEKINQEAIDNCATLKASGDFFSITKKNLTILADFMVFHDEFSALIGTKSRDKDCLRRERLSDRVKDLDEHISMYRNTLRSSIHNVCQGMDMSFERNREIEATLDAIVGYLSEGNSFHLQRAIALFGLLEKLGFGSDGKAEQEFVA